MEIEAFEIDEEYTVLQAMERLDELDKKIVFVQCEKRLVASITDGDIRRFILSGGGLQDSVKRIANYSPKYLLAGETHLAKKYMKQYAISAIPVVNDKLHIQKILFADDRELDREKQAMDIPVVIMAGGLGTRLYPYTKILPKPLIPVGEIPIVEHIINQFREFGCNDFHLIVNHKKNMIKAYFNEIEKDYSVSYADEDIPLGTGGGLSLLKGKIDSTFILTNCDILILEDFESIYRHHKQEKNIITMVCSLKKFTIPYGVVEIAKDGTIENMKEKPDLTFFTNTGCYFVEPEVIEQMRENEKIGFPDIVEEYRLRGEKIGVYPISEQSWLDMGQMDELEKMKAVLENK